MKEGGGDGKRDMGGGYFTPEAWAELEANIQASEVEYERGEYKEYGPDDKKAFLDGVIQRGRALLAAEKRKAS